MALTQNAKDTYKTLFGNDPQKSPTDPGLMEILQNQIFDEVFSTGVLDNKMREIITVTTIAALGQLPQLKAHTNAALNVGNTPLELREAVYQCAPYIGWPMTLNAVGAMNGVFKDRGCTLPLEDAGTVSYDEREDKGAAVQTPLYGDEVKSVFAALPGDFGTFVPHLLTASFFGDFETRGVLSVKVRELLGVVILTAIGQAMQLKPHINGAVKAGNTLEEVTAALVQALPYTGFPKALSALVLITQYDASGSSEAYR